MQALRRVCDHYSLKEVLIRKINNALATAFINIANGMEFNKAIDDAVEFITARSPITKEELTGLIFPSNLYDPNGSMGSEITPLELMCNKKALDVNLTIKYSEGDSLHLTLSCDKFSELMKKSTSDNIIALIERYSFLCPTSGFFWSIHPDVYALFETPGVGEPLEIIEAFSSPFNNNLEKYCSLFQEDQLFGSQGNFFTEIRTRGSETEPETSFRRWIINPPYTNYVIDRMFEAISMRMNRYPEDEYYFLLPWWPQLQIISKIESRGVGYRLTSGRYRIYDHLKKETFSPCVDMYIGVLKSYAISNSLLLDRVMKAMTACGDINPAASPRRLDFDGINEEEKREILSVRPGKYEPVHRRQRREALIKYLEDRGDSSGELIE